ncbi:MAG: PAS domain-containing protein [Henriciella sp.]|jgi:hypothetical protein|nr:PAS domain-containing protein [Henriciella sp.]
MNRKTLHPNTNTLLSAWERMSASPHESGMGPATSQHTDLVECLFVIERAEDGAWVFRNAGKRISNLLGRELAEHNYLDLWTGHDRAMVDAFLSSVSETRLPGIIRARGETLTGMRIDIELTLAPLSGLQPTTKRPRLLGLYQTLGGDAMLMGRPVWRHRLNAIFPPDVQTEPARLKLVANND